MAKVSVIMPVYNACRYLKKAVESIVNQDYSDFECILVDDGSTDGSAELCDELSAMFSCIQVIHQKNGGICNARNTGLKAASGDYIMFCDDDDLYMPGFIATAVEEIEGLNVDCLRYQCVINDEKKSTCDWDILTLNDLSYDEFLSHSGPLFVWNAIYRASVMKQYHLVFDEKYKYGLEDFDFNLQFFLKMKSAAVSSKVFYHHFEHAKHSTSSNRKKDVLCFKYAQEPALLDLEYECVKKWCSKEKWISVLNERKAEVLARFRHQMKEADFDASEIKKELSLFRKKIEHLPHAWNDFMNVAKGPNKSWMLLLLFELKLDVLLIRL